MDHAKELDLLKDGVTEQGIKILDWLEDAMRKGKASRGISGKELAWTIYSLTSDKFCKEVISELGKSV